MSAAAIKARACFALAASTSYPAERATAINRGMAILEKHGLNADHFDIPGRVRSRKSLVEIFEYEGDIAGFSAIFGACVGCGAVASVGVMCQACAWKAEDAHQEFLRRRASDLYKFSDHIHFPFRDASHG